MTPQAKRLTPEELMQPRYEVIADYPGSEDEYEVGQIKQKLAENYCKYLDKYPHIFRRLNWWEHRTQDQMPEYVKLTNTTGGLVFVCKVAPIDKDYGGYGVNGVCVYDQKGSGTNFIGEKVSYLQYNKLLLPATLQDYTQYINSLK